MGRIAVTVAFIVGSVATAHAEDPNRWQGWVAPDDKNEKGVDVSMVTAKTSLCRKPFIGLTPRFRNRYQEKVAGKLKVEHVDGSGATTTMVDFTLDIGENKVETNATLCHDSRKSLAFSFADFKFPVREAEQAKIAEQKAAAEKAAAEEAAKRKAAADKAAAEQAAAEAERKRLAADTAERDRLVREKREQEQREQKERERRELSEQEQNSAESARYRDQRAAEAVAASSDMKPQSALPTEKLRNGEIMFAVPVGFQTAMYGTDREAGMSVGLRGGVRFFKWVKVTSEPGRPLSAAGFELGLAGGWSKITDLLSRGDSSLSVANGSVDARFWYGPVGIGLFGDWTRHARTPLTGPSETQSLFAIGPQLCVGIIAGRTIGLEASVKAGAVASGGGLTGGTSENLFVSASLVAEFFQFYGGAIASKYQDLSDGIIPTSWNAVGVLGMRLPY